MCEVGTCYLIDLSLESIGAVEGRNTESEVPSALDSKGAKRGRLLVLGRPPPETPDLGGKPKDISRYSSRR